MTLKYTVSVCVCVFARVSVRVSEPAGVRRKLSCPLLLYYIILCYMYDGLTNGNNKLPVYIVPIL